MVGNNRGLRNVAMQIDGSYSNKNTIKQEFIYAEIPKINTKRSNKVIKGIRNFNTITGNKFISDKIH